MVGLWHLPDNIQPRWLFTTHTVHKGNTVCVSSPSSQSGGCASCVCDIFSAFSHASRKDSNGRHNALTVPICTKDKLMCKSLHVHTHEGKYLCASYNTLTLCSPLCTVASSQDLWQCWIHIPMFPLGAQSIEHRIFCYYSWKTWLYCRKTGLKLFSCRGISNVSLWMCVSGFHAQVMDSCTATVPPHAAGHGGDRDKPLGPSDLNRSGSGSAHIQLFLSLNYKEGERRGSRRWRGSPHYIQLRKCLGYILVLCLIRMYVEIMQ